MAEIYPIVILSTYLFNLFSSGATIIMSLMIICLLKRVEVMDISLSLHIYILSITFSSVFMFIESSFLIGWWRYAVDYPIISMFWWGLVNHALLANVPASIFFMSLDRCLVIIYKCKYRHQWSRVIGHCSLFITITLTISILIVNLLTHLTPKTQAIKPCIGFQCTMNLLSRLFYNGSMIFISVLNIAVGICYLVASKRYQQSVITVHSDFFLADLLTARALVFAFIFHFIPHTILIFYVAIFNDTPLTNYGSYSRTLISADCFCSSIVNLWLIIRKIETIDREEQRTAAYLKSST